MDNMHDNDYSRISGRKSMLYSGELLSLDYRNITFGDVAVGVNINAYKGLVKVLQPEVESFLGLGRKGNESELGSSHFRYDHLEEQGRVVFLRPLGDGTLEAVAATRDIIEGFSKIEEFSMQAIGELAQPVYQRDH